MSIAFLPDYNLYPSSTFRRFLGSLFAHSNGFPRVITRAAGILGLEV
ncbi:MAG TPA: hypothetical protein VEL52_05855 [Candidatus Bathyarchaeia archaeon]|nr:hypothetical protein [Candidatus Bathyarchaeia archaeon]